MRAALIAFVLLLVAPAAASASALEIVRRDQPRELPVVYDVTYSADPVEANRLDLRLDGQTLHVDDPGATFRSIPPSCERDGTELVCATPRRRASWGRADVDLADADDR